MKMEKEGKHFKENEELNNEVDNELIQEDSNNIN